MADDSEHIDWKFLQSCSSETIWDAFEHSLRYLLMLTAALLGEDSVEPILFRSQKEKLVSKVLSGLCEKSVGVKAVKDRIYVLEI